MKLAYSINEAVEATSLSRRKIYNLVSSKQLETRKIGTRTVITAASLAKLVG